MTDNEIIKALKCCTDDSKGVLQCAICPYQTKDLDYCVDDLLGHALDLINRLQAANNGLMDEIEHLHATIDDLYETIEGWDI